MDKSKSFNESYSEYKDKPVSPLERLRAMEDALIKKHEKIPPTRKKKGIRTAPEKPKKTKAERKKGKGKERKYGLLVNIQVKRTFTGRAIRFMELMGGLTHFIETLAVSYEYKNPHLFKDLPDKWIDPSKHQPAIQKAEDIPEA